MPPPRPPTVSLAPVRRRIDAILQCTRDQSHNFPSHMCFRDKYAVGKDITELRATHYVGPPTPTPVALEDVPDIAHPFNRIASLAIAVSLVQLTPYVISELLQNYRKINNFTYIVDNNQERD